MTAEKGGSRDNAPHEGPSKEVSDENAHEPLGSGASPRSEGATAALAKPPAKLWKNPWVISAILGVLFMTIMAPMMKHVPEPPPVLGALPAGLSIGGDAVSLWSAERVTLVAFSRDGCFTAEEALFKAHASFFGTSFESGGGLVDARSVVVVDAAEDASKSIAALRSARSAYSDWPVAAVTAAAAQPLRRLTPSEDGGCGAGLAGWLTIVDRSGQVRGLYSSSDENVMSELHHRSQHVWFERLE
jgi:hypothetical protein